MPYLNPLALLLMPTTESHFVCSICGHAWRIVSVKVHAESQPVVALHTCPACETVAEEDADR